MPHEDGTQQLTIVQTLAEAVSTQARIANKRWLGLMTVAVLALLPRKGQGAEKLFDLPWFGKLDASTFYWLAFAMLIVLSIGLAAAHAHTFTSQELAQSTIDKLAAQGETVHGIHPRDLYDMLRVAGLTQVFPLARLLSGSSGSRAWRRMLSAGGYAILKTMSLLLYFGLPAIALWQVYHRVELTGWPLYSLRFGGIVAAFVLAQILVFDLRSMLRNIRRAGPNTQRSNIAANRPLACSDPSSAQLVEARKMRIAILGWGSLLWEGGQEFDNWHGPWQYDGPNLKIEFSRVSARRLGALTLVTDADHGSPTIVAWCLSKRGKIEDAVADLRCREGTANENIGYICLDQLSAPPNPLHTGDPIVAWARQRKLDAVVWTALKGNFEKKAGKPFSVDAVVAYIKTLSPAGKAKAAEYVWRAPEFVQTAVRSALQQEPWFSKPGS